MKTFSALMLTAAVAVAVANLGCSSGCPNDGHEAAGSSGTSGSGGGGGTGTGGGTSTASPMCVSIYLCDMPAEGSRVTCESQHTYTYGGDGEPTDTYFGIFQGTYGANTPDDPTITFKFKYVGLPTQFKTDPPFPCRDKGDGLPAAINCPSTPSLAPGQAPREQITCVSTPADL